MKRKEFIKKGIIGAVVGSIAPASLVAKEEKSESTYDKLMTPIDFNHLPNKNIKKMNKVASISTVHS